MRPAIVLLTTFATLVHLTFGCCLHGGRCRGGAACCAADRGKDCPIDCGDEHRHACDHDQGVEHEHDGVPLAAAAGGRACVPDGDTAACAVADVKHHAGHACAGCRCAALIEGRNGGAATEPLLPAARDVVVATGLIGLPDSTFGRCRVARLPGPAALQQLRCERLQI